MTVYQVSKNKLSASRGIPDGTEILNATFDAEMFSAQELLTELFEPSDVMENLRIKDVWPETWSDDPLHEDGYDGIITFGGEMLMTGTVYTILIEMASAALMGDATVELLISVATATADALGYEWDILYLTESGYSIGQNDGHYQQYDPIGIIFGDTYEELEEAVEPVSQRGDDVWVALEVAVGTVYNTVIGRDSVKEIKARLEDAAHILSQLMEVSNE